MDDDITLTLTEEAEYELAEAEYDLKVCQGIIARIRNHPSIAL